MSEFWRSRTRLVRGAIKRKERIFGRVSKIGFVFVRFLPFAVFSVAAAFFGAMCFYFRCPNPAEYACAGFAYSAAPDAHETVFTTSRPFVLADSLSRGMED